jgi:cytidylate kinase
VVAIDGPSASGKSTVAREVARRLGVEYVDTGAMYRAVAWAAVQRGIDLADEAGLGRLAASLKIEQVDGGEGGRLLVDGTDVTEAIRSPEVSAAASIVSVVADVREALVARQRARAAQGGAVMEGRDIGTVVVPEADLKVFLDASLDARARRRYDELWRRGIEISLEEVRRQVDARDHRDETRAHSPLRAAPDAMVIDTTSRSPEQAVEMILSLLRDRMGRA